MRLLTRSKKDVRTTFCRRMNTFSVDCGFLAVARAFPGWRFLRMPLALYACKEAGIGKEQLICRSLPGGGALLLAGRNHLWKAIQPCCFQRAALALLAISADGMALLSTRPQGNWSRCSRSLTVHTRISPRPRSVILMAQEGRGRAKVPPASYVFDVQTLKELAKTHPVIYPDAPILALRRPMEALAMLTFGFSGNYNLIPVVCAAGTLRRGCRKRHSEAG